ncbi:MAG: hypothetical protein HKN05_14195 [Rhizobiales bacterium]|nr:hypothetical protein [Hyphomicrobiales bacterium]
MTEEAQSADFGPWNPGLNSTIPQRFLPLSTLYQPENTFTHLADAQELSDFTGLAEKDLVRFRPERLLVHETLIRVMANLSVPDGSHYGDLGINFRSITDTILAKHAAPKLPQIVQAFDEMRARAEALIIRALDETVFRSPTPPSDQPEETPSFLQRLFFGAKASKPKPPAPAPDPLTAALTQWTAERNKQTNPEAQAALNALIKTATAIAAKRGHLMGGKELITQVALTFMCNGYGSELVGQMLEPIFNTAVEAEGFTPLPLQPKPVIMNVKGASAAGKSTLRPLQQKLAARIGVNWQDFALISPDIWRKYLLDYDTLGEASKYAGMLTGHELEIIDKKLDRYMAAKAADGQIPHLLIDRFRFDSFASPGGEAGGRLLTRFGDLVYMFFMITPPEATVERAWGRGLEYGRYKAVDDLLDHNVEAYSGMPDLFFTWALNTKKKVHYEFLDNSVPKGTRPRTVAFGWNGEMTVFDIKCLLDVDRFAKINLGAATPAEVYQVSASMAPEDNTGFLKACGQRLACLNLADPETGRIYAELNNGKLRWADQAVLDQQCKNAEIRAGIRALIPDLAECASEGAERGSLLDQNSSHTLGQWSKAG